MLLGGALEQHPSGRRLRVDESDPLATSAQIAETLNSLEAIRIRPATCDKTDLIAVREVAILRAAQSPPQA